MPRAHLTLTVEIDCVSAEKLDKRKLKKWLNESIAEARAVTIWDAHVRAVVEPGGRTIEWDLDGSDSWGDPL
jgi:hypothetical protein